jgi:hypothetical protein
MPHWPRGGLSHRFTTALAAVQRLSRALCAAGMGGIWAGKRAWLPPSVPLKGAGARMIDAESGQIERFMNGAPRNRASDVPEIILLCVDLGASGYFKWVDNVTD